MRFRDAGLEIHDGFGQCAGIAFGEPGTPRELRKVGKGREIVNVGLADRPVLFVAVERFVGKPEARLADLSLVAVGVVGVCPHVQSDDAGGGRCFASEARER